MKGHEHVVISYSYHNNSFSFGYTGRVPQSSSYFYLSCLDTCVKTYNNPSHSVYYSKALHFDATYSGVIQRLAGIYYRAGLVSLLLSSTVRDNAHACWEEGRSLVTQIIVVYALGYGRRLVSLTCVESYQVFSFPIYEYYGQFFIIYFDKIIEFDVTI